MNWEAKGLSTVSLEKIWKNFVDTEGKSRGVYENYRPPASMKNAVTFVTVSTRSKDFLTKPPIKVNGITITEKVATPRDIQCPSLYDTGSQSTTLNKSRPRYKILSSGAYGGFCLDNEGKMLTTPPDVDSGLLNYSSILQNNNNNNNNGTSSNAVITLPLATTTSGTTTKAQNQTSVNNNNNNNNNVSLPTIGTATSQQQGDLKNTITSTLSNNNNNNNNRTESFVPKNIGNNSAPCKYPTKTKEAEELSTMRLAFPTSYKIGDFYYNNAPECQEVLKHCSPQTKVIRGPEGVRGIFDYCRKKSPVRVTF